MEIVFVVILCFNAIGIVIYHRKIKRLKASLKHAHNLYDSEQSQNTALVQRISTQENKFNALCNDINAIQVAIVMFDANLKITFVNTCAAHFFDKPSSVLIGKDFSDHLIEKDALRFQYIARSYIDTRVQEILEKEREVNVLAGTTQRIAASLKISPVNDSENPKHCSFVATLIDISAQKQLAQIYEEQASAAMNANISKSMFLAKMSHEIRTPLHGILGSIQLIERLDDPTKQKKLLQTALRSGENLANIINDILDLSKIESNAMSYEKIPFSMREITQRIFDEIQAISNLNNTHVTCSFSDNFKNNLLGDPTRIGQVIMNLMSNAVKFTKNGHVSLHLSLNTSKHGTDSLLVSVEDTGIGISRLAMKNLFEPFSQADNSTTRIYGGSGLGLSISKNICQQLGGDLTCTSKIGKGSKFSALIPTEISDQKVTQSVQLTPEHMPDLSKLRVLMVEDNDINAEILKTMLEQMGCSIIHAKDGQEGIDKYHSFLPDIILMDIHMPIIDGLTACKILREQGSNTPILAVTANVMKDDIQNYKENGFDGHVPKPILQQTLLKGMADAIH